MEVSSFHQQATSQSKLLSLLSLKTVVHFKIKQLIINGIYFLVQHVPFILVHHLLEVIPYLLNLQKNQAILFLVTPHHLDQAFLVPSHLLLRSLVKFKHSPKLPSSLVYQVVLTQVAHG